MYFNYRDIYKIYEWYRTRYNYQIFRKWKYITAARIIWHPFFYIVDVFGNWNSKSPANNRMIVKKYYNFNQINFIISKIALTMVLKKKYVSCRLSVQATL